MLCRRDRELARSLGWLLGQLKQTSARRAQNACEQVERVGLARIELATSALSVLRSNRLSYSPLSVTAFQRSMEATPRRFILRLAAGVHALPRVVATR
jgi:hypothetical protein